MTTDLIEMRRQINVLEPNVTLDSVLAVLDRIEFFERLIRELRCELEPRVIEWIKLNGAIECETIRYYVGNKKTTKCLHKRQAVEAILAAVGGDLDGFSDVLVAQPLKYGSAKTVLSPEAYRRCFITVEEPELREGKPVPKLLRVDTQFLR